MIRRAQRIGFYAFLILTCGFQVACKDSKLEDETPSWLGESIYEYLGKSGTYTYYLKLIDDLGYAPVLSKTGSKTLFVANDEAFERFFLQNQWGVDSYAGLSKSQKQLLLNAAMINNAYQIKGLSSVPGPDEGKCLRRVTAQSVYDSVWVENNKAALPSTLYWHSMRQSNSPAVLLNDYSTPPMVHFIQDLLDNNNVTNLDMQLMVDSSFQRNDVYINGVRVAEKNIVCKNGFIHQLEEVMLPLPNMAEIIESNVSCSKYNKLLNRYCAPYYLSNASAEYNRLYNRNDSVFERCFFSTRGRRGELLVDPTGAAVDGYLKFDPAWNAYEAASTDMGEDMAAMLVPTDAALDEFWNRGGKDLQDRYGSWENVPDEVLSKLINNLMLNSFWASVPSKFEENVLNDASEPMGLKADNVVEYQLGCNGMVMLVNRVFGPTSYVSVSFPALINDNMKIIYWAIEQLEFYAYLNSMDSRYSFIIPTNEALLHYVDPVSYGKSKQKLIRFYYDQAETNLARKVKAYSFEYDMETGTLVDPEDSTALSTAEITDRLEDMLDYHIIVGDIEDGKEFYRTKGGGTIRVQKGGGRMMLEGGFQTEEGRPVTVQTIYDKSVEGNGKSYIVDTEPMLTSRKTVYDLLQEHTADTLFLQLLSGSSLITKLQNNYATASMNIDFFSTYHYTVYVPKDSSIQRLISQGFLPTWEDFEASTNKAEQEMIQNRIEDFLKYHFQDNAIFVEKNASDSIYKYETAAMTPSKDSFYRLKIQPSDGKLSITDNLDNKREVITQSNDFYNQTAREYQYNSTDVEKATQIVTSSFATVHLIDGVLLYGKEQLTKWKTINDENDEDE